MTESEHDTRILTMGLREQRLESGLTQAELATRAGVSRQLVAAVEAGRNVPAVDAAIGLARALSTTTEELFGGRPRASVRAALGGRLRDGAPVRVGRVGDALVAAELADHGVAGAGWAKPDGVMRGGDLELFDQATVAGVVVAGCDPALGIAEGMLSGLGSRSVLALSAPTGIALRALERGDVHAAVVHDRPGRLPRAPLPVARWHLARWQVGLGVPTRYRDSSLEALLDGDLPIVQRDRAAASQRAFERAGGGRGRGATGAGSVASGHLDAARTAAMLGAGAVTTEGAARAFGLPFLALEEHVVEIWVALRWLAHPGIEALGELLGRPAFTARVAQFGGYDLSLCGTRLA
jgi:DNA-binding XRE family transcriptional regulator